MLPVAFNSRSLGSPATVVLSSLHNFPFSHGCKQVQVAMVSLLIQRCCDESRYALYGRSATILIVPGLICLSYLALAIFDAYNVSITPPIIHGGQTCANHPQHPIHFLSLVFVSLAFDFGVLALVVVRCVSLLRAHREAKLLCMVIHQGSLTLHNSYGTESLLML